MDFITETLLSIYFHAERVRVLIWLMHLLPLVMLVLTRKLPWKQTRNRVILAQLIISCIYFIFSPCLLHAMPPTPFYILVSVSNAYRGTNIGHILPIPFAAVEMLLVLLVCWLVKRRKAGESAQE